MFYRVRKIPAGNVCAISGLDMAILRSGTLCTSPCCPPFSPMTHQAVPLVQVDIQPKNLGDFEKLRRGLYLLDKADASVEVDMPIDKGENLLRAAGQVHLETCIQELQERFARIELHVSPPIVKFKEGVYHPQDGPEDYVAPPIRVAQVIMPNRLFLVRFRVKPMPQEVIHALEQRQDLVRQLLKSGGDGATENTELENKFKAEMHELMEQYPEVEQILSNAWLMDPEGMNVLLASDSESYKQLWSVNEELVSHRDRFNRAKNVDKYGSKKEGQEEDEEDEEDENGVEEGSMSESLVIDQQSRTFPVYVGWQQASSALGLSQSQPRRSYIEGDVLEEWQQHVEHIETGIRAGFRAAAKSGPLCEEPLWGVVVQFSCNLYKSKYAWMPKVNQRRCMKGFIHRRRCSRGMVTTC
eukprot:TRINITY_DN34985_c0_g1_i2.p1 TRINITY_DN34985_c0_g1~~TRINITY_DN34985_c0_g1_i2.p1  ORF type:complete len:480 (+),score=55.03 TRINITY_DN34985_c0_g1_i2:207-1442(+)